MQLSDHLKTRLVTRLQNPLPGEEAQNEMASYQRRLQPNKVPRLSAVLMHLFFREDMLHCTMIQRPAYEGTHGGQIAFPGGKKEKDDPSLVITALRETEEEVGIKLQEQEVLGPLSSLYIPPSNFMVTPYVLVGVEAPTYVADPFEVDEVFDLPLSVLYDPDSYQTQEIYLKHYQRSIQAPSIVYREKKIWGATAMMLSELKALLDPKWCEGKF